MAYEVGRISRWILKRLFKNWKCNNVFSKTLIFIYKNNLLQLQRKWLSLPLLILFPVAILLLITTIAIIVISPSDEEPVHIGFVDLDQSEETQLIMGMITESSDIESYIQIEEL